MLSSLDERNRKIETLPLEGLDELTGTMPVDMAIMSSEICRAMIQVMT